MFKYNDAYSDKVSIVSHNKIKQYNIMFKYSMYNTMFIAL